MNCRLSKAAGMRCAYGQWGLGIGLGRLDGFGRSGAGHDFAEKEQR